MFGVHSSLHRPLSGDSERAPVSIEDDAMPRAVHLTSRGALLRAVPHYQGTRVERRTAHYMLENSRDGQLGREFDAVIGADGLPLWAARETTPSFGRCNDPTCATYSQARTKRTYNQDN